MGSLVDSSEVLYPLAYALGRVTMLVVVVDIAYGRGMDIGRDMELVDRFVGCRAHSDQVAH